MVPVVIHKINFYDSISIFVSCTMQPSKTLFVLFLLLTSQQIVAQVVNIESRRITTDTNGFNGRMDANFFASKNRTDFFNLGTEAQIQYKQKKSLYLILANLNYTKANGRDALNDGFAHFRYNYKFTNYLRWELFSQFQYNKLLALNKRYLLGSGPRLKWISKNRMAVYSGHLIMFENEIYNNIDSEEKNWRMSNYLSWTISVKKHFSFTGTIYYQPLLRRFSDYRISGQSSLQIFLGQHLYFRNVVNFISDSKPPTSIPKLVYTFQMGLGYILK